MSWVLDALELVATLGGATLVLCGGVIVAAMQDEWGKR